MPTGISITNGITVGVADASNTGFLSKDDWVVFNSKQGALPNFNAGQILFGDGDNVPSTDSGLHWDNVNKQFRVGGAAYTSGYSIAAEGSFLINSGILDIRNAFDKKFRFQRAGYNSVSLEQDTSRVYFYNETTASLILNMQQNGRIGVGTFNALAKQHIIGEGASSATTSLLVQNSVGTNIIQAKDNGQVSLGSYFNITHDGVAIWGPVNSQGFFSWDTNEVIVGGLANTSLRLFSNSQERMRISVNGSVGMGTTTPHASSILDLSSTSRGFLPPRMTTAQINAITSPSEGLIIFNTTISHLCSYQSGAWVKYSHSPM